MSIKIDTEQLETNIMFLKNDMSEIDAIMENLKQATEKIEGSWSSNFADEVIAKLKSLYPKYEAISTSNKNLNSFLNNIVVGDYTQIETDIDKLIDDKISLE